jgi:hypothetical protein
MLLQRFVLRVPPGTSEPGVRMEVTLRPDPGICLTLERRPAPTGPAVPALAGIDSASGCPFHR